MIDLHCHLLPDLDDGAADLSESLKIAAQLERAGFKKVIATPHVLEGRDFLAPERILAACARLNQALRVENRELQVIPGAEVYLFPELPRWLDAGNILTLGNLGKYLLLELPAFEVPLYAESVFFELQAMGVRPVLAHPERNLSLRGQLERLVAWAEKGLLFQLDLRSLSGRYGPEAKMAAERLARSGLFQFAGTDAHDASGRTEPYRQELETLERLVGSPAFRQIMLEHPQAVLEGREVVVSSDIVLRRRRGQGLKARFRSFFRAKNR